MKLIKNNQLQEAINNVDGQKFEKDFKGVASVEYADAVQRMQAKHDKAEKMYKDMKDKTMKDLDIKDTPKEEKDKYELSESLFTTWLSEAKDDWDDGQDIFSELDYILTHSKGRNKYPELKKFATYGGSGDRIEVGAGSITRDGKYYDFRILAVNDDRLDYAREVAKLFGLKFTSEPYRGPRSYYSVLGHIYLPVDEAELTVDEFKEVHVPENSLTEVAPVVAAMGAAAAGAVATKLVDKVLGEDVTNDDQISVQMDVTPGETNNSVAYYLNMLIKDEWDAIQGYQDAIAAIKSFADDFGIVSILEDIEKEENLHVGQLQKAMQLVAPSANDINKGEEEAAEQLGETTPVEGASEKEVD